MLVLDIGNSATKWAVWQDERLNIVAPYTRPEDLPQDLPVAYAAVGKVEEQLQHWLEEKQALQITGTSRGPLYNGYATPHTLGADRWCAIHAAWALAGPNPVMVIDIGTAVTTDVAAEDTYLGGSISPGLALRYRALNEYTARLPLLQPQADWPVLGTDTATAITNGVQQGLLYELQGHIYAAQTQWKGLSVFLTGGQAHFFAKRLENGNFVHPNLVLEGIARLASFVTL